MRNKYLTLILIVLAALFLGVCAVLLVNVFAPDPIEKGLSYIAAAIVTHGLLQILFRT